MPPNEIIHPKFATSMPLPKGAKGAAFALNEAVMPPERRRNRAHVAWAVKAAQDAAHSAAVAAQAAAHAVQAMSQTSRQTSAAHEHEHEHVQETQRCTQEREHMQEQVLEVPVQEDEKTQVPEETQEASPKGSLNRGGGRPSFSWTTLVHVLLLLSVLAVTFIVAYNQHGSTASVSSPTPDPSTLPFTLPVVSNWKLQLCQAVGLCAAAADE